MIISIMAMNIHGTNTSRHNASETGAQKAGLSEFSLKCAASGDRRRRCTDISGNYDRRHSSLHIVVSFSIDIQPHIPDTPFLKKQVLISFYEPLWFFHRVKGIEDLKEKKISIGPEGSGTRVLTLMLLEKNGIDERSADFLPLTPKEAGERLVRGEIEAALMLTSWDSPVMQQLLTTKGIELASSPRADAYIMLTKAETVDTPRTAS